MNYYYSAEGSEVAGPYSLAELTSLFANGTLPKATQVCREGEQAWQPLSSIIETTSARPTHTAMAAEIGQSQRTPPPLSSASRKPVMKACPMCGEQILATAKKCKHCGEYLDSNRPFPSSSTTSQPLLIVAPKSRGAYHRNSYLGHYRAMHHYERRDWETNDMTRPNHAMQLTASARHGMCGRPADPPAHAAPRSGGS